MVLRTQSKGAPAPYREAGEWLREQREYWQITQAELAEQAGVRDVSMIDGIEAGEIALPRFMQSAIALAYGIDRHTLSDYCESWYGQERAAA